MIHDQHVHSKYSEDSKEELSNYIELAISKGCKYFVTTDHVDFNVRNIGWDWLADFDKEEDEYNLLQKQYPNIKLMMGIEIGFDRLYLDKLLPILNGHKFSLVNLSVHNFEGIDFYNKDEFINHGIDNLLNVYFDAILDAINTIKDYDVLCHFDYAFKCAKTLDPNIQISKYEDKLIRIFEIIIKDDKALEINTKVQESINDDNHIRYFLNLYKKLGGKYITLSSDAHRLSRYMSSFDHIFSIIKECGFFSLSYFVDREMFIYNI